VKLFVAAVEALKKKERQNKMKMSLAKRNTAFLSFNTTPTGVEC
jgi:hypothetical protein